MANIEKFLHSEITNLILQAYYKVYNQVGFGFDKSDYSKALSLELRHLGCQFEQQKKVNLLFDNQIIGHFEADLWFADKVLVQVTTQVRMGQEDLEKLPAQTKHSGAQVGLLLNFGIVPEHKRRLIN